MPSESSAPAVGAVDRFIKYAGPLLGIATAAMTLYVAITSRDTNERLAKVKTESESLALASTQYDLSARVVAEFGAQNAREFAATFQQKKVPVDIPDAALRRQLTDGVGDWKDMKHLMTGDAATGLYLRQVVLLRLTSIGKTALTDLRLTVRQNDFGKAGGTQLARYGALDTQAAGWVERTIPLSSLMEASAEARSLRTEVLIPLAEVSGGEYYFGRVMVPVRLSWRDQRQGKDGSLDLDVAHESALDNQLGSAILGRSR